MSKGIYIVNCYTCQHNGQETCKGCNTLLNGDVEPYENWELREDLSQKDQRIAELEQELAELKEKAIVPKFSSGQIVYFANIVEGTVNKFNYIGEDKYNYVVEDKTGEVFIRMKERTFATGQEAQAKLKEIEGS